MASAKRGAWAAAVCAAGLLAWLLLREEGAPVPPPPPAAGGSPSSLASGPAPVRGADPPAGEAPPESPSPEAAALAAQTPSLEVRVLDAAGSPVADATVYLLPGGLLGADDLEEAGAVEASTGEDGRCLLPLPLPSGSLGVAAGGYLLRVQSFPGVSAGGSPEPLEVILDRGGVVAGRVVAAREGTPVAGAEVNVFTGADGGETAFEFPGVEGRGKGLQWCLTGSDGAFVLHGIPVRRLRMEVEVPGYLEEKLIPWEGDVDAPAEGVLVSLLPMPILTVTVAPWEKPAPLLVSLRDSGTGAVVAGRGEGESAGRVRLGIPRDGGEFELRAEAPGRGWARAALRLEPRTEAVDRTLDLRPWPGLQILPPRGTTFAGLLVVRDAAGEVVRADEATGETASPELPPGRYELLYFDGERVSAPCVLDLEEGDGQTVVLDVGKGAAFRVGSGTARGCRVEGPDGPRDLLLTRNGERQWDATLDLQAGDIVVVRPGAGLVLRTADPGFEGVPLEAGRTTVVEFAR